MQCKMALLRPTHVHEEAPPSRRVEPFAALWRLDRPRSRQVCAGLPTGVISPRRANPRDCDFAVQPHLQKYFAWGETARFFVSPCSAGNASIFKLVYLSRHKSVNTLRGYTRSFECFRDVCTSSQGLTGVSVNLHLGTGLLRRFCDGEFVP